MCYLALAETKYPPKSGSPTECLAGCAQDPWAPAPECPRSVRRVSTPCGGSCNRANPIDFTSRSGIKLVYQTKVLGFFCFFLGRTAHAAQNDLLSFLFFTLSLSIPLSVFSLFHLSFFPSDCFYSFSFSLCTGITAGRRDVFLSFVTLISVNCTCIDSQSPQRTPQQVIGDAQLRSSPIGAGIVLTSKR